MNNYTQANKSVFSNNFTLRLKNEKIQEKYEVSISLRTTAMIAYLIIISIILLVGMFLL